MRGPAFSVLSEFRSRLVAGGMEAVLLEALLDRPQVGGLAQESRAVDMAQLGEGIGIVLAEVPEQLGILVEAEELADHLDGQDFAVVQLGREAALADVVEVQRSQLVIDQAEDGQHIIIKSHGASPLKDSSLLYF